jgi:hypothetical protein
MKVQSQCEASKAGSSRMESPQSRFLDIDFLLLSDSSHLTNESWLSSNVFFSSAVLLLYGHSLRARNVANMHVHSHASNFRCSNA